MKYFLILIIGLLFHGCSHRNAFSNFNLNLEERKIVSNTQSTKINSLDGINGLLHLVYLNNTSLKQTNNKEIFLLSIYMKEGDIHNYHFSLNNTPALEIHEIDRKNYSQIIEKTQKWNKYYLITFKQSEKKKMDFVLKNEEGIESKLTYNKY